MKLPQKSIAERVRRRLQKDDSLYFLAQLGLGITAVTVPPIGMIAFVVMAIQKRNKHVSAEKIRNSFYSLKRRGLLTIESTQGKTTLSLTPEAQNLLRLQELNTAFEQKHKKKWNGAWYVVMFDIKNKNTNARNALRTLLQKFGFAYLQKSAWVYPHDCRTELSFLKSFFLLSDRELRVLECKSIGNDKVFKERFHL